MRSLVLASALAVAALSLSTGAAFADDGTCVTTTDKPFAGTTICVQPTAPITGTSYVPYSAGPVCVGAICTPPESGTLAVPRVDLVPVNAWGQLCEAVYKNQQVCVPFTSDDIERIIGSGQL